MTERDATVTPVVSVSDVPSAHRVLQCPLLLDSTPDSMTLVVGSRDEQNRGRLLLLDLTERSGAWRVTHSEVLLSHSDVAEDCVGVMPGDLTPRGDGIALLGNAYFRTDGLLSSVLFAVDLVGTGRPTGLTLVFPEQRAPAFRATPGAVRLADSTRVVYLEGAVDAAGGFPPEYHFEVVPVDAELQACGPTRPLMSTTTRGLATAKFSQEPDHEMRAWFSHRMADGLGYQLGRCLLDASCRVTSAWWEDNAGLGRTPHGTQMLSYPEPLGGGRILACTGRFGDQGLGLIDTQGLAWAM